MHVACKNQLVKHVACMHACWQAWLPARDYVKAALEGRAEVYPSGEIIRLARSCPWKEHLYELEAEMGLPKPIKFCIYEVQRPPNTCLRRMSTSMRAPILA